MEDNSLVTEKKKNFDMEDTKYAPHLDHKRINQYISAVIVNLFAFTHGTMLGWPSPITPLLQSETPPNGIPRFTDEDVTWAGSILALSGLITVPIFSYTLDKFGRKITAYIMAAICIVSWVLIIFANSALMIHAARFLGGLAGGGTGIVCPTYVIDMAEDDIKGKLGSLFGTLFNAGCLFTFIVGSYMSYTWTGYICLGIPVVFVALLYCLPESPIYLLMKGKELEARKAMIWFRNGNLNEEEMLRIMARVSEEVERKRSKISFRFLTKRATFRALLIGIFLMLNNQLSGSFAILNYTVLIFKESGSNLSPNLSAILVGALLTFGGYIATILIERTGRRPLLITTNILVALSLIVLGFYFWLKSSNHDVEYLWWLPVTCLSVYILTFACGIGTLTFPILVEITSPQARGAVTGIGVFTISLAAFVISKTFLSMSAVLGMHGSYWFFAACCIIAVIIIYVFIPETKNRRLEDIMEQLESDNYIRSVISGYSNFKNKRISSVV